MVIYEGIDAHVAGVVWVSVPLPYCREKSEFYRYSKLHISREYHSMQIDHRGYLHGKYTRQNDRQG